MPRIKDLNNEVIIALAIIKLLSSGNKEVETDVEHDYGYSEVRLTVYVYDYEINDSGCFADLINATKKGTP